MSHQIDNISPEEHRRVMEFLTKTVPAASYSNMSCDGKVFFCLADGKEVLVNLANLPESEPAPKPKPRKVSKKPRRKRFLRRGRR